MQIDIRDVIVKNRIRQGAGDLTALQSSMEKLGLLYPIIVDTENNLLAGFRRLQAAKALGWDHIDALQIKVDSQKQRTLIESEENTTRLDFTVEEKQHIEDLLRRYKHQSFIAKVWAWLVYMYKRTWAEFR